MTDKGAYEDCIGGSLRLKGAGGGIKKKKKKKNRAREVLEAVEKAEENASGSSKQPKRTPAELAFIRVQEKRQAEKVIEKAKKTHKQRVEEFNSHLNELSEHYDIPKVSWTK